MQNHLRCVPILFWMCMLASQACGLRTLTQATATAATANRNVATLQASLRNITGVTGRPVSYKNIEAALYVAYASGGLKVPNAPSTVRRLPNNTTLLTAWQNSTGAVNLAFYAATASNTFNATDAAFAPTSLNTLLRGNFAGGYPTARPSPGSFLQLAGTPPNLAETVANVSAKAEIRRVLCTGYGNGGALAQACGIWAAVTYPAAVVRVIAFGAPVVGNADFSFSLQQLVNLGYLWSLSTHLQTTNATVAGRGPAKPVYLLKNDTVKNNTSLAPNSFDAYVAAVQEYARVTSSDTSLFKGNSSDTGGSGGISGFINDVTDVVGAVASNLNNLGDILDAVKSFVYKGDQESSNDQDAIAAANRAKAAATGCPPLLCTIRPASDAACQAYQNGTNTIGKGSVTVGPVADTDTQVAVNWNATSRTATFAFRGTASQQGWLQDFKVALQRASTNTALDQFFPNIQIHQGFLESLLSVTQQAKNQSQNISAVLDTLAGGPANPTKVNIIGHSLGAAIAAIAGPWAALTYPAADVQIITFGSPFPGNKQFSEVSLLLAGRQNRVVHALDVVPALPPLDNYVAVDFGRWAQDNDTILVQDRPKMDINDLTWDDHSCRLYQFNVYNTNFTTSPLNVVAALANGSTTSGDTPQAVSDAATTSAADRILLSAISLVMCAAAALMLLA